MRKGFTLIELIIVISVISIILITIGYSYRMYIDTEYKSVNYQNFLHIAKRAEQNILKPTNVIKANLWPRGVFGLDQKINRDNWKNNLWLSNMMSISKIDFEYGCQNNKIYGDSVGEYLLINDECNNIRDLQEKFTGITGDEANNRGNKIIFLVQNGYKYTPSGVYIPYKTYTVVHTGRFLFNKFKTLVKKHHILGKAFLHFILQEGKQGYSVRKLPNDLSEIFDFYIDGQRHYITHERMLKTIFGTTNIDYALKMWDREKYNIYAYSFSDMNIIENYIEETIKNMRNIAKSIEDWGSLEAKIAAYDSVLGDNLNKDYFITCEGEGCKGRGYYKYSSGIVDDYYDFDIDITRTFTSSIDENRKGIMAPGSGGINEDSIEYGFFACECDDDECTKCVYGDGEDNKKYPHVIDVYKFLTFNDNMGVEEFSDIDDVTIGVYGAVPISGGTLRDDYNRKWKINNAARELMMNSGLSINSFNLPIFFTNGPSIMSFTPFYGTHIYPVTFNSVPIKDKVVNPPYTAKIYTIFPFFVGGILKDDESLMNIDESNWLTPDNKIYGTYDITLLAHIK